MTSTDRARPVTSEAPTMTRTPAWMASTLNVTATSTDRGLGGFGRRTTGGGTVTGGSA